MMEIVICAHNLSHDKLQSHITISVAFSVKLLYFFPFPFGFGFVVPFPFHLACLGLGDAHRMIFGGADLDGLPLFLLGGTSPEAIFLSLASLNLLALANTSAPL